MIGFTELIQRDVERLPVGSKVFIQLTGEEWIKENKYYEDYNGIYNVGENYNLWNAESDEVFYTFAMKEPGYEFSVYAPIYNASYEISRISDDIDRVIKLYNFSFDKIITKIKENLNVS